MNYFRPIKIIKGFASQNQIGIRVGNVAPSAGEIDAMEFRAGITQDRLTFSPVQVVVDSANALMTLLVTEGTSAALSADDPAEIVLVFKSEAGGRPFPLGTINCEIEDWGYSWA